MGLPFFPQPKPSKVARAVAQDDKQRADDKQLEALKREVWIRDKSKCRNCERKVIKSLALTAKRGEVAHIRSRQHKPTRYLRKNAILLCYACHAAFDQHVLVLVGTATFEVDGAQYIDGDAPVEFLRP